MNSDSTNKAHNKVKTPSSLPEAVLNVWLGFAEEVQKHKQKTTWPPFPFLIDSANTFCGALPLAHKTLKKQSPNQNSGNTRLFVGSVRGDRAASCFWVNGKTKPVMCEVIFTLPVITFALHLLTQFTFLPVAGEIKLNHSLSYLFVNKADWIQCVCVCVRV